LDGHFAILPDASVLALKSAILTRGQYSMSTTFTGLVLILCGVLAMLGSALNWRIVTHSGKLFNMLLGDRIARIVYFGVGVLVFMKGIELAIGARWLPF
jgi:hypothetical protein